MKLDSLIKSLEIVEKRNMGKDLEIKGIAYHSSKVKPGYVYVAIRGYLTDGHKYIEESVSRGAVAIVLEEFNNKVEGICQIKVPNSRQALSRLGSNYYGNPSQDIRTVGVTATNGKTTTTFLLESIYARAGKKSGIIGSVLTKTGRKTELASLTTPESLDLQALFLEMKEELMDRAVMEVSSSALELYRVNDVDFDIVSFNNFSREHIDQHGSYERYWEVKSSLVRNAKPHAIALLNVDNEKIESLKDVTSAKVVTISIDTDKGMIYCANLGLVKGRGVFDVVIKEDIHLGETLIEKGSFRVEMKIPGYHSVENAMMASAIALADGIDRETIKVALGEFAGVERRFEFIYEREFTIIDDHFANIKNINSTLGTIVDMEKNNVHIVYAIRGNRGVTVNRENAQALTDWKEKLGVKEIIATRSLGSVTGKDAVSTEEEAVFKEVLDKAGLEYTIFNTLEESIESALRKASKGDIVLLAGCQGMDRGAKIAFDIIYGNNPKLDPNALYKPLARRVSEVGFIL